MTRPLRISDASEATIAKFWDRVDRSGECWTWKLSKSSNGYGQFYPSKGAPIGAHRFAAMISLSDWDPSLDVCHSCDNPPCVNPAHLWMGTARDNALDMSRKGRAPGQNRQTCIYGHPFDLVDSEGRRRCRTCTRERSRRYEKRVKEACNGR